MYIVDVSFQYRENYGAHNWSGVGECPQHWKNKGAHNVTAEIVDTGDKDILEAIDEVVQDIIKNTEGSSGNYEQFVYRNHTVNTMADMKCIVLDTLTEMIGKGEYWDLIGYSAYHCEQGSGAFLRAAEELIKEGHIVTRGEGHLQQVTSVANITLIWSKRAS